MRRCTRCRRSAQAVSYTSGIARRAEHEYWPRSDAAFFPQRLVWRPYRRVRPCPLSGALREARGQLCGVVGLPRLPAVARAGLDGHSLQVGTAVSPIAQLQRKRRACFSPGCRPHSLAGNPRSARYKAASERTGARDHRHCRNDRTDPCGRPLAHLADCRTGASCSRPSRPPLRLRLQHGMAGHPHRQSAGRDLGAGALEPRALQLELRYRRGLRRPARGDARVRHAVRAGVDICRRPVAAASRGTRVR